MENANQTQEAKGYLIFDPEDIDTFAQVDFSLKSGQHIQDSPHQAYLFDFIVKYEDQLVDYYKHFFNVTLASKGSAIANDRYYFLQADIESSSIMKTKGKKLDPKHALLGIFLLKLDRIDKFFQNDEISVDSLIAQLKEHPDYREHVYRLFAKATKQEAPEIGENTINEWITKSLNEFENLGFIKFRDRTKTIFEILPAIDRLFRLYSEEIQHIDQLPQETATFEDETSDSSLLEE